MLATKPKIVLADWRVVDERRERAKRAARGGKG
jgi:hypothetical protein